MTPVLAHWRNGAILHKKALQDIQTLLFVRSRIVKMSGDHMVLK